MLQVRAVTLSAYTDVARFVGIDGGTLLREHGIPLASLEDPEGRISALAAAQLLETSAARSGIDSFGLRMAECRSFASIGPLALLLQHLPSVHAAIECLAVLQRRLSDVIQVSCEELEGAAIVRFDLTPEIRTPQGIDLQVALGYLVIIGISQGRWKPEAVHFTHDVPSDVRHFSRYFNAPLEFNSSFNGFSCSRASLTGPLPLSDATMAANARGLLRVSDDSAHSTSLLDHVKQSIALLLPSGRATLDGVARNLGMTKRTLQRRLTTEGAAFAIILNEVRKNLAVRYLASSARQISEIAGDLGYTNLSSFSRWFTTEFQASPSRWRGGLIAKAGPPQT